jgi:hypothetical protein
MPRKQWAAYERVTSTDVNSYLSDQSVMVFATTTARDAAIPVPTVGMQSAVQASPDVGAPRYWDGSTWALVKNSATQPAVWGKATAASITSWYAANLLSTWNQVIASAANDLVIYGISDYRSTTPGGTLEIGTGASGSEVVRFSCNLHTSAAAQPAITPPYGVFVPTGTRVAVRSTNWTGSASDNVVVHYANAQVTGVQVQAGVTSAVLSGTTYVQVGATPPIAGGVEVIGYSCASPVIFGLGAASSEVVQTGTAERTAAATPSPPMYIPTFTWTSGARLAVKSSGASTDTCYVYWRESLL